VAIGPVATSAGASSVALGQGAVATNAGDVALGSGSVTAAANAPTTMTIGGVAYNLAGSATSVVSVGAPGAERQITNVAPGQVSATSTDAVNGSQLYATNTAVTNALDHVSDFVSDNSQTTALPTSSGVNATAGGLGAYAGGANSVVVGNMATDNGVAGSTVLGEGAGIAAGLTGSNVAIGQGSQVLSGPLGTSSVTIGGNVYSGFAGANPAGVVSFGTASAPRVLTNVAAGAVSSTSTDAVNGSELYSVTEQVSQTANTVANILGGGATSASGAVTSPTYTVYGQTTTTVAQAVTALQQASPVQYATSSGTASGLSSATNTVTLVGSNSSAPVTVTNVAAGTAATDAVNLSQLASTQVHYFSVNNGTAPNGAISTTGGSTTSTSTSSTAAANYNNTGASGAYSVAISQGASATAAGDVALGYNSTASGNSGGSAVSVGAQNTASGAGAVAIGDPLVASGNGAVALGQNDTANGNGAVSLGESNVAIGDGSVAVGNLSTAAASGAIALGNNAVANNANDVALGSGSFTGPANPTSGIVLNGVTYAFAGSTPSSVVSVGAPGAERQITNVAAGRISSTSTDAINGSELYATDQSVAAIGSTLSSLGVSVTSLGSSVTSLSTTVSGLSGGGSNLVQQQGGSPGSGTITVGANTGGTTVNVSGTSGDRQITGVAAGTAANDAVNVGQLEAALGGATANAVQYDSSSHSSVTLGAAGTPVAVNNVAAGAVSATSTQAVNGSQLYATNTNVTNLTNGAAGPFQVYQSGSVTAPVASGLQSTAGGDGAVASGPAATAIGYRASATGQNSVAIGANSNDGGQANVVSVGSPGNERRITNVAPGVAGTDAVNVNQLVAAENTWQNNINAYVQQANAGIALALASSGLHYDSAPGTTSLAGAASYYADHAGIAFGLNHTSADGRWRYNIATTFVSPQNGANVGVVAGFSYTFGH
jgi:autotransporter adhesin